MMKVIIILIICFQFTFLSFGQRCHTTLYNQHLMIQDPHRDEALTDYNESYIQYMKSLEQFKQTTSSDIVYIPVVFHILYKTPVQNIPDSRIFEQINRLNTDYSASNSDTSTVPLEFKPFISDTKMRFILAFEDPNGNPTTGIIRHQTNTFSFLFSNDGIKNPSLGGVTPWNTLQYLNIWVGNINNGILGYATNPIDAGTSKDGVVLNYKYVGNSTLSSVYNLGRTATHEIGHYLGLDHPWGSGGCLSDDGISDTPNQEEEHYGVPIHPMSSCGSNDMFMNYMDYPNDEVLVMFTEEQKDKMEYSLDVFRNQLALPESVGLDKNQKKDFIIYPNPASDIVYIQHHVLGIQGILYFMDINGKTYISKPTSKTGTTAIEISKLNPGIYFIGLKEGGQNRIVEKLIIQ